MSRRPGRECPPPARSTSVVPGKDRLDIREDSANFLKWWGSDSMDTHRIEKARLLLQLSRYADAERAAKEVIAEDPANSEGYYLLSQALLCLDRYQEALEVSDELLTRSPNQWYAHSQRAALLQLVGRVTEAVESAETAVRLDPTESAAHYRLATALWGAGRGQESTAVISRARREYPDNIELLHLAGLVAWDLKDMGTVGAVAKRGLAVAPTDARFHALSGMVTGHQAQNDVPEGPERQSRHRAAEQRLAEAVRMKPTDADFRRLRRDNARDSRDEIVVKLITGWTFCILAGVIFLPIVVQRSSLPCWCWLVLPLGVAMLGGIVHAIFPEFSLVLPLRGFNVVTLPLLPEERRKGRVVWYSYLATTVALLFLPILLMPAGGRVHAPDTPPAHRDGKSQHAVPVPDKTHRR